MPLLERLCAASCPAALLLPVGGARTRGAAAAMWCSSRDAGCVCLRGVHASAVFAVARWTFCPVSPSRRCPCCPAQGPLASRGWRTPALRRHLCCVPAWCPLREHSCRRVAGSLGTQGTDSAALGLCEDPGAPAGTVLQGNGGGCLTCVCFPVSSAHATHRPRVSADSNHRSITMSFLRLLETCSSHVWN